MGKIVFAALLLLASASAADARHRVASSSGCVETIMIPCYGRHSAVREASSQPRRPRARATAARHAPVRVARHSAAPSPAAPTAAVSRSWTVALGDSLVPQPPRPAEDGIVRAASGVVAYVAKHATAAFQCVVTTLEQAGYPIREMGGWARGGHIRHSLHYRGIALDVNQTERNVTKPPMPADEVKIANGCGLISGAQWRDADSGHFQLGGWAGYKTGTQVAARQTRHRRHYAARRVRHQHYASGL